MTDEPTQRSVEVIGEPQPFADRPPRYSDYELPAYRFVPGRGMTHPARPGGHLETAPHIDEPVRPPHRWRQQGSYLYGTDLFNLAYWWESHEAWEQLWKASDDPMQRYFCAGLIQLGGALLKWHMRQPRGVRRLAERARKRMISVREAGVLSNGNFYMGVDLPELIARIDRCFGPFIRDDRQVDPKYFDELPEPMVIRLHDFGA